jgi:hypothetical protein
MVHAPAVNSTTDARRRDVMKSKTLIGVGILSVAGLLVTAGTTGAMGQAGASTGPAVKPAAVQKKAGAPPPASAKPAKSVGKGKVTASTANSATDDDSFWIEQVDVDGDGNVDDASLIWDDEDRVLYAYATGTFTCKNGGTGEADMLIATNAAGNPRKRPAGSGFWVVDVDKGECGAQAAGLLGCRFDASGAETACGVVTVDEKNDDIVIVTASK